MSREKLVIIATSNKFHFASVPKGFESLQRSKECQDIWYDYDKDSLFGAVESKMIKTGIANNVTSISLIRECGNSRDYEVIYNKSLFGEIKAETDHENGLYNYALVKGFKFYLENNGSCYHDYIANISDSLDLRATLVIEDGIAVSAYILCHVLDSDKYFEQALPLDFYFELTKDNSLPCLNGLWKKIKSQFKETDDPDYLPESFLSFSAGTSILDVYEHLQSFNADFKDESIEGGSKKVIYIEKASDNQKKGKFLLCVKTEDHNDYEIIKVLNKINADTVKLAKDIAAEKGYKIGNIGNEVFTVLPWGIESIGYFISEDDAREVAGTGVHMCSLEQLEELRDRINEILS